ncbi:uncharacterized protein FYW61_015078 [Anableps anableps]
MLLSVLFILGLSLVPSHSKTTGERLDSPFLQKCFEEAKKIVDDAYKYSREESLTRVRKDVVQPHNALHLLKQPRGDTRSAVRSADYMAQTLRLVQDKVHRVHKRSLNATYLLTDQDLITLARITGCEARIRNPSCHSTPNINKYRTVTSVCNNLLGKVFPEDCTPILSLHPASIRVSPQMTHLLILSICSSIHPSNHPSLQLLPSLNFYTHFAHLAIQPVLFRLDANYREHPRFPSVPLFKAFLTPWRVIFEGGVDPLLRGLLGRPAKLNTQDHMMVDALRERLFQFVQHLALDLGSLNMQWGRDHGLPGYNAWRRFCGLSQPRNQAQLAQVLKNPTLARKLLELYGTPENIDVWLGGVAEPFVPGGRVGPLFACLIATQFKKIREGDRLWYQNPGVFTPQQRQALSAVTLSRVICDNTGITSVPSDAFSIISNRNRLVQCSTLRRLDLSAWREIPGGFGENFLIPETDLSINITQTAELNNLDPQEPQDLQDPLNPMDPVDLQGPLDLQEPLELETNEIHEDYKAPRAL